MMPQSGHLARKPFSMPLNSRDLNHQTKRLIITWSLVQIQPGVFFKAPSFKQIGRGASFSIRSAKPHKTVMPRFERTQSGHLRMGLSD